MSKPLDRDTVLGPGVNVMFWKYFCHSNQCWKNIHNLDFQNCTFYILPFFYILHFGENRNSILKWLKV
jgi:hypothetical protein